MFKRDELVLVTDILGDKIRLPFEEAMHYPFKVSIEEIIEEEKG